jgi:hypothetical protein
MCDSTQTDNSAHGEIKIFRPRRIWRRPSLYQPCKRNRIFPFRYIEGEAEHRSKDKFGGFMSKVITGNGLHTVGLTTTTDEIPARDKLFKDDPLDANFLKQLGIKHSLDDLAEASDAHVLTRSREINVNWKDVYGESLKLSVAPIRQYFEDSWGMDVFDIAKVQIRKYDPGVGDDADTNKRYIPVLKHKPKDVLVVAALPDPPQDPPVKSIPQVANPWSSEELGRGKDFIVTHGVSKREYRLSFDEESVTHDAKVRPDSGNAAYLDRLIGEMDEGHPEKFWSYVTGVDLVIKATDKKNEQAFFMEVHTVDLSIQAVFERANTLLIQRAFAEKLDAGGKGLRTTGRRGIHARDRSIDVTVRELEGTPAPDRQRHCQSGR